MDCKIHGAMLCYGNAYFKGKLKRIYRCVAYEQKRLRKGVIETKEVRKCERLVEVFDKK